MTLKEFEKIFSNEIVNHYLENQKTFDAHGIHGCLHISRSLIICRWISKELNQRGLTNDIDKVSYAVSFHDSGRKANGIDYWEWQSKLNCLNYLIQKGIPDADYISSLIVKKSDMNHTTNDFLCLHDTDVLEIIRPSTGIGIQGFNREYLKLKQTINYDIIFGEVVSFIYETEGIKQQFFDKDCLINLINYLEINKSRFPNLYDCSNT